MQTGAHKIPKPVLLGEVAWEVATTNPPGYIPTGIKPLDDLIVGATDGELLIIAGSPSQGKTALAMQICETAAEGDVNVGIFSLEMSPAALSQRLLAARSGVSVNKLRRRADFPLNPAEQAAVEAAAKEIAQLKIAIDPRSGLNGDQVYETVKQWKDMGVGLVMLDYIQLMEGDNENRQEAVGKNVRQLKNAARDFTLPFIALSQVSRAVNTRDDKKPRMSDLRDSGQIEQVGDTILMFHYPNAEDQLEPIRAVDVHAVKQRQGPVGYASLYFDKPSTRFITEPPNAPPAVVQPAAEPEKDDAPADNVWGS